MSEEQLKAILLLIAAIVMMGIFGGIENGTIPF